MLLEPSKLELKENFILVMDVTQKTTSFLLVKKVNRIEIPLCIFMKIKDARIMWAFERESKLLIFGSKKLYFYNHFPRITCSNSVK